MNINGGRAYKWTNIKMGTYIGTNKKLRGAYTKKGNKH